MSLSRRLLIFFSLPLFCVSQTPKDTLNNVLDEVIVSGIRIGIPLSKKTHSVTVISAEQIRQSGARTLAVLLQQEVGVDIRQRGPAGTQADLYIRGGGFDQTLLLIDGIKLEDAQTGHHLLNLNVPLSVIERIEIIKGPAARVYGPNAFTGAIHIITKKQLTKQRQLEVEFGSFQSWRTAFTAGQQRQRSSMLASIDYNQSNGYRYNSDFKNLNGFLKNIWHKKKNPLQLLAAFNSRQFGANGFYATPDATDQYEATQASLLALTSQIEKGTWNINPKIYWRRHQDEYIYIRKDPSVYRNMHISNKTGLAIDATFSSSFGKSGLGIDVAHIGLKSNNLGTRKRQQFLLFVEHQFWFYNHQISVTPGIAVNYFNDFGWHNFPGMDVGLEIVPNLRIYGNLGYTYRVPTFTDLFYQDRTTIGNKNLEPETGFTKEIGVQMTRGKFIVNLAAFDRQASNLIDYVKEKETDLWQANNIALLNTFGLEGLVKTDYRIFQKQHRIEIAYTYLKDELGQSAFSFSRYAINSLKHHFIIKQFIEWGAQFTTGFVLKHAERTQGNPFQVLDLSLDWRSGKWTFRGQINNLLSTRYSETNLVPMPLANGLLTVGYDF